MGDPRGLSTERLDPEERCSSRRDWFLRAEHIATYEFARAVVRGKRVLDLGCGTGYGAARLAADCEHVVGVDVSGEAIDHATAAHGAANLAFQRIPPVEAGPLPFDDRSFDVVLSFQVIEHVPEPDTYLREAARVLAPSGVLICVTPDRATRLFRGQRPWNAFHLTEYTPTAMASMLRAHFGSVEVRGMSAPPEVLEGELRRTRRLRVVTYPFTFPRAPERLRATGLGLLRAAEARARPRAADQLTEAEATSRWGFDEGDIDVFVDRTPSINVVCVARDPRPGRSPSRPGPRTPRPAGAPPPPAPDARAG